MSERAAAVRQSALRMNAGWWVVPALAVVAYPAYGRGFVNTDAMWTLAWGRQLAHLQAPSYAAGPTPHPLSNLLGLLLSPLGPAAEPALHAIGYLAVGAVIYATGLLAHRVFGRVAGPVAALLVASRVTLEVFGALAYLDVIFTALVLWALLLESAQPRRGGAVVALLLIAGLLRPEAWLLSGVYILYVAHGDMRRTLRLGAIAAAAPLLWVAADLAVTGEPLYSLTRTQGATPLSGHATGARAAIRGAPRMLMNVVQPATAVAAIAALAAGLRRREVRLVLAALVATACASAIPVASGTPLNDRYFLPTIALLCCAASGVVPLALARVRPVGWRVAGAVCVALLIAWAPQQYHRLRERHDYVASLAASRAAAHDLVRAGLPCQPLVVPNARLLAVSAVWLDVPVSHVRNGRAGIPAGSWGTGRAMLGIVRAPGRGGGPAPTPRAPIVRSKRGWALRAACAR